MPPAATVPGQTIRQKAKASKGGSGGHRDVVKPVLANPFTVAWPSLPNHLQAAVLAALPEVLPATISGYHVSRQRCSRAVKRRRKQAAKGDAAPKGDVDAVEAEMEAPPPRPELLDQLVFGLNETIKALEHGIEDLRFRMLVMSDALAGKPSTIPGSSLLPTAAATETSDATPPATLAPLAYVLVANLSVSPQSLIDPLPVYCATYNTLLRQHSQLAAEVRRRLPKPERFITIEGPEIRLVPLGKREADISAMIGLRRVSTFAIRNGHPALEPIEKLLPNSVLPPPRHSITLPFPNSSLAVHDAPATLPAPVVQYPSLHVKGIHTTAPTDTSARKNTRLIEVRRKRIENKEKRHSARVALERAAAADIKAGGKPGGRAARIAAKQAAQATKTAAMDVDVSA